MSSTKSASPYYVAVVDLSGSASIFPLVPSLKLQAFLLHLHTEMKAAKHEPLPAKVSEIRIFQPPISDPAFHYNEATPPSQMQLKRTIDYGKFSMFYQPRLMANTVMSNLSRDSILEKRICFIIVDLNYIIKRFKSPTLPNVWNRLLHITQMFTEWSFADVADNNGDFLTLDDKGKIPAMVYNFLNERDRVWRVKAPDANPTLASSLAGVPEMSELLKRSLGDASAEDGSIHSPDDNALYGFLFAFLIGRIYVPRALTSSSYARESAICPLFSLLQPLSGNADEDVKFFHSQQDPDCAFIVDHRSKKTLARYSPASDSAITFKGIVIIRLEVQSDQNEADKWRMLVQSISNNRVATYLLHHTCGRKPILTFAFYVDRDLRVTEFILWSEPESLRGAEDETIKPPKVNIFSRTADFDLALADTELGVVQFMKRLYHIKMFYKCNYGQHIDDDTLEVMLNGMRAFKSTMAVLPSHTSIKRGSSDARSKALASGQEKLASFMTRWLSVFGDTK